MRVMLSIVVLFMAARASAEDLVYSIDGMDKVTVRSNLLFKKLEGSNLAADFYLPPNSQSTPCPAIIFVLGDAPPATLRDAKDWPFLRSYGRLAAASGFAGVTFNHRSSENFRKLADVRGDIRDAISFVRAEGKNHGIDSDRLCLWFFSGSGPHLGLGMGTNAPFAECIVAYYPLLAPPPSHASFEEFSALAQMRKSAPRIPPLLLVKAGRDTPGLNRLIDEFRDGAAQAKVPVDYLEHPTGPHAFDIRDNSKVSRKIIEKTMIFIRQHLLATAAQGTSKDGTR